MLLNPKKAQAFSGPADPGDDFGYELDDELDTDYEDWWKTL